MKVKFSFDDGDHYETEKMKRMLQADSCFSLLWEMAHGQLDLSTWLNKEEEQLSEEDVAKLREWLSNIIIDSCEDRDIDLDLWT